jgi:hypothetical protein
LLGAILGDIESLTCGTTDMWDPHVSDSMSPRMAPSNVTESQWIRTFSLKKITGVVCAGALCGCARVCGRRPAVPTGLVLVLVRPGLIGEGTQVSDHSVGGDRRAGRGAGQRLSSDTSASPSVGRLTFLVRHGAVPGCRAGRRRDAAACRGVALPCRCRRRKR